MSFQYLSEDQRARYRRFLTDPSPEDLERFFYLDAVALAEVAKKRGPHNRLGWAGQWGTVRMLGTFLADPGDGGAGSNESGTNWGRRLPARWWLELALPSALRWGVPLHTRCPVQAPDLVALAA